MEIFSSPSLSLSFKVTFYVSDKFCKIWKSLRLTLIPLMMHNGFVKRVNSRYHAGMWRGNIILKTKAGYQYYYDISQVLSAHNCHKYEINNPIEIFHVLHTVEIVRLVVFTINRNIIATAASTAEHLFHLRPQLIL